MSTYRRYQIQSHPAPNLAGHPSRFQVRVDRIRLARLLLQEMVHYRGNLPVVLSRPCVYGVFSGPIGGFAPRQEKCVGCLRCTVQYPEMVQVHPNPERLELGDSYFSPDQVDTILYEASTGRVPVRGAGYRGAYGGPGWDGMWTDMSEIVRPTRDGIHGREFISTSVDLGGKPRFLTFTADGKAQERMDTIVSLPVPFIFDILPVSAESEVAYRAVLQAASAIDSLAFIPFAWLHRLNGSAAHAAPVISARDLPHLNEMSRGIRLLELDGWDPDAYEALRSQFPDSVLAVRAPFDVDVVDLVKRGVNTLHLVADYHGSTSRGFILTAVREAHERLVESGLREQTTLIGSGGIVAAEHVPKALIAGFDAVALDTPSVIALQGQFLGEGRTRDGAVVKMPSLTADWGAQRLTNLAASWRDQLLEILGAMGLREVRRLRGEVGRAMFQDQLEREAFEGIVGIEAAR